MSDLDEAFDLLDARRRKGFPLLRAIWRAIKRLRVRRKARRGR